MPSPLSVMEQLDIVTGPFGYVRLLGDRKAVDDLTPTLDHIVIDRSEQIRDDAKAIKKLSESVPVIVAVNNHFAGYSPQTIRELREEIDKG
jgi:glutaredoxin